MHLEARGYYVSEVARGLDKAWLHCNAGKSAKPGKWAAVQGNEFYAKFTGMELKNFPDVPIKSTPLLDTSTHKLAIETDPCWVMVIRHVGSWRVKTRPKVRIYPEGTAFGKVAVCFRLPAAHRFETPEAAFRALQDVDFTLSPHNLNLVAVQKRHEEQLRQKLMAEVRDAFYNNVTEDEVFSLLELFNTERAKRLPKRPKQGKPDNVVSFDELRERIARILDTERDNDEDYRLSLRSAG